jgi:hypothetical protein
MSKQFRAATAIALGFMIASAAMTHAQTAAPQPYATTEDIRAAVVRNVGSQDSAVEASQASNVLIISRINSNMNGAPHQLINNEAVSIAGVVSKAIANTPYYETIHTIRVRYLDRLGSPPQDKVLDSVEFRKGSNGKFDLHVS